MQAKKKEERKNFTSKRFKDVKFSKKELLDYKKSCEKKAIELFKNFKENDKGEYFFTIQNDKKKQAMDEFLLISTEIEINNYYRDMYDDCDDEIDWLTDRSRLVYDLVKSGLISSSEDSSCGEEITLDTEDKNGTSRTYTDTLFYYMLILQEIRKNFDDDVFNDKTGGHIHVNINDLHAKQKNKLFKTLLQRANNDNDSFFGRSCGDYCHEYSKSEVENIFFKNDIYLKTTERKELTKKLKQSRLNYKDRIKRHATEIKDCRSKNKDNKKRFLQNKSDNKAIIQSLKLSPVVDKKTKKRIIASLKCDFKNLKNKFQYDCGFYKRSIEKYKDLLRQFKKEYKNDIENLKSSIKNCKNCEYYELKSSFFDRYKTVNAGNNTIEIRRFNGINEFTTLQKRFNYVLNCKIQAVFNNKQVAYCD